MSDETQTQDATDQREAGGHDDDASDQQDTGTDRDDTLAKLSRERREARERARNAEARLAELEAKQREADEAKAKEEGRYKELLEQREADLTATATERDALKGEVEVLTEYFTSQYNAALKELPDVITAFAPDEDAPFAEKSAWLTKAQEQAKKVQADKTPGHLPNPKPSRGQVDEKAALAHVRRTVRPI